MAETPGPSVLSSQLGSALGDVWGDFLVALTALPHLPGEHAAHRVLGHAHGQNHLSVSSGTSHGAAKSAGGGRLSSCTRCKASMGHPERRVLDTREPRGGRSSPDTQPRRETPPLPPQEGWVPIPSQGPWRVGVYRGTGLPPEVANSQMVPSRPVEARLALLPSLYQGLLTKACAHCQGGREASVLRGGSLAAWRSQKARESEVASKTPRRAGPGSLHVQAGKKPWLPVGQQGRRHWAGVWASWEVGPQAEQGRGEE